MLYHQGQTTLSRLVMLLHGFGLAISEREVLGDQGLIRYHDGRDLSLKPLPEVDIPANTGRFSTAAYCVQQCIEVLHLVISIRENAI